MSLSKEMQEALDNPAVHYFTKDIINAGANKDICDVLHDLEYCQYLFTKHMTDTLDGLKAKLDGRVIV